MNRKILHVDQNCFFASVEMKNNPHLRDVPMAVCGDQERRHGIMYRLFENCSTWKSNCNYCLYRKFEDEKSLNIYNSNIGNIWYMIYL